MRDIQKIVIIGNGVAGNSAAASIRSVSKETAVTMISKEPFPEYCACVLSKKYISNEMKREEVFLKTFENYSREGIRTTFGRTVSGIDVERKAVLLETGVVDYDKLIIATGGRPIIPPLEGIGKKGIFTMKSLGDAELISNYTGEKAVVIGAGPIGLELSIALKKRGWKVTLVELLERVLPKAFDEEPSSILRKIVENYGIEVLTGEKAIKMSGATHVEKVITDKREIECDMVIMNLGMRPEVELARKAGLEIGRLGGIKVDRRMMTSTEDVYACGDCIEATDVVTSENLLSLLWHNAKQQGEIAGYNSAGITKNYAGSLNICGITVLGVSAVSIGHTAEKFAKQNLEIIEENHNGYYYRLLVADDIFVGAQFVGKIDDMGPIVGAIWRGESLDKVRRIINDRALLSHNPWFYRMHPYIGQKN